MFGQILLSTFQWTFSTFCHFCTSLYFVIAVHSSVSDQKRFKWGCVRNAFPRIWCTNSYIAREALAKRCHRDKCARDGVNPNLLKALREINGWSGSGVACTVSCFALRSSLIAIKSRFTFWCFSPGFRWAREDLTATLMPSLRGLSITPTHTCMLVPQVRADHCRHALVTTEPGKQKWWNADSRGSWTHTQKYLLATGSGMHCALEFNYNPE